MHKIIFIAILVLQVGCSKNEGNKAGVGNVYSYKIDSFEVILVTKKIIATHINFEWEVCNKDKAEKHGYGRFKNILDSYTKAIVRDQIRHIAADIQNTESFYSPATNKELEVVVSEEFNKKGLCVKNIKMYPHNKSFNLTQKASLRYAFRSN